MTLRSAVLSFLITDLLACVVAAAPNFADSIERPLRYSPQGTDFVFREGSGERLSFNRPLYGTGTPFRVDAGDKPEFSLFLPGRGGVLRLGIRRGERAIWLIEAQSIESRYRPGSMLYTIRDPLLGSATLLIDVMASFNDEALLAKIELEGEATDLELVAAFGGVNGERGSRNGDIGTEKLPINEFFQLRPEHCKDTQIDLAADRFTLIAKPATLVGRAQPELKWKLADAKQWADVSKLVPSDASDTPVVLGTGALRNSEPQFIRIDRRANPTTQPGAPAATPLADSSFREDFAVSEFARDLISMRLQVKTPDPFLNSAVSALNVAAEGTWDGTDHAIMHGAVAWRNKLLGWRGVYWPDALGLHDRLPLHLDNWMGDQNDDPIPAQLPAPEAEANLSRNETALHSNGNLTSNHYDMNLVAIDALFRHLLWTGDKRYAIEMWARIERHLAWERRLFRREFGADKLPLYEGYACIWASDDVGYNGGGATHSSAYNAFHNRMAAKVAKWIGVDGSTYEKEADLIEHAMRQLLWIKESGHYAEWKDLLGEQRVHPSAAAWTVYHAIDSRIASPDEAWSLARYAAASLPRIPIAGKDVPPGTHQIATSNWFPYQWSTNNVVMAESAHTALAMFQAGRSVDAFALLKGCILDSMYLGQCPGNVGMCTPLDMARGESQRDFADGCGVLSRAVVEGLFGIEPDAIDGILTLSPRFPKSWDSASIVHSKVAYEFRREGNADTYSALSRLPHSRTVRLVVPMSHEHLHAQVDGQTITSPRIYDTPAGPRVDIEWPDDGKRHAIRLEWSGKEVPGTDEDLTPTPAVPAVAPFDWKAPVRPETRLEAVDLSAHFNARVVDIFRNEYLSPRSPFVSLAVPKQGIGSWCKPGKQFEVEDSGLRALAGKSGGTITLPNGVSFATRSEGDARNILFTSQWDNYPKSITLPLSGNASHAFLLMTGSTNAMQSQFDNGEVIVTYADGSTARLPLRNPETWWPIDQDFAIDDFAFRYNGSIPPRIELKTGQILIRTLAEAKGKGRTIPGGAATVLHLPLDPNKQLKSLTVHAIANEVVIGLMGVTLERPR